jgi:hypothetical protein
MHRHFSEGSANNRILFVVFQTNHWFVCRNDQSLRVCPWRLTSLVVSSFCGCGCGVCGCAVVPVLQDVLFEAINAQGVIADTVFQAIINIEKGIWNATQPLI